MTDERTLARLRAATGDIHAVDLEEHLRRIARKVAQARGETDETERQPEQEDDEKC